MKYSKNEIGVVVKMRRYDLYIIDDQFINYYYGRERIFYNLFKDYEKANRFWGDAKVKLAEWLRSN